MTTVTTAAAISAIATAAWNKAGHDPATFAAATAALPPRVGACGWASRWAAKAAAALAAEKAEAAKVAVAAWWAAAWEHNHTPKWGVVKEWGVYSFSNMYFYEVRFGAGDLTRDEAEAAKAAAKAADKKAQAHSDFWDAFMA
jgi:hypothetical protein